MKQSYTQWLIFGGVALIIITALIIQFHNTTPSAKPLISTTVNKTYADTKNYFQVKIPDQWATNETTAKQTTGLNTPHPITRNIQVTQLYSDQGVGVTIQVYEEKPDCPIVNKPNTTFGGLPAYYNALRHEWTIYTTTSMIVVRDYYPGTGIFHMRVAPTAIPTDLLNAYKTMLQKITASFHLNTMQPLSC